jgi:hypothetical protein
MATDFTILDMTFYFLRLSSMSVSTRAPHSTCRRAALTERAGKPAARQDSQNGHCPPCHRSAWSDCAVVHRICCNDQVAGDLNLGGCCLFLPTRLHRSIASNLLELIAIGESRGIPEGNDHSPRRTLLGVALATCPYRIDSMPYLWQDFPPLEAVDRRD